MLRQGRIPMNEYEDAEVDRLIASDEGAVSLSRADPGEKGDLLVQIGETTYRVAADGSSHKE